MQLLLLLGDAIIDEIAVDKNKVQQADYLIFLQQELITRNEERLDERGSELHFAIEGVSSAMSFQSLLDIYGGPVV